MTTMLDLINDATDYALREWWSLSPTRRRDPAASAAAVRPLVETAAAAWGWPDVAVSAAMGEILQRAFHARESWDEELDAMAAELAADRADDLAAARDAREDLPW